MLHSRAFKCKRTALKSDSSYLPSSLYQPKAWFSTSGPLQNPLFQCFQYHHCQFPQGVWYTGTKYVGSAMSNSMNIINLDFLLWRTDISEEWPDTFPRFASTIFPCFIFLSLGDKSHPPRSHFHLSKDKLLGCSERPSIHRLLQEEAQLSYHMGDWGWIAEVKERQ